MKDLKDITCCVVDHGLFIPVAQRLAKGFKRVLYHSPWEEGFPTINKCIVGDGFADIERCDDIWKAKKEIDLFVFPDIQNSGLQLELESQGFPVWGSRDGDSIEINRQKFHKILSQAGLEVPTFTTIKGLTKLRDYLKGKENKFIKISKYRGSLETCQWRSWHEDEGLLDVWAVRFGPAKELVPFMVFEPIDTDLEIGGDTYCIDGEWPSLMIHGDEWKDKGFLGTITERKDMPEHIQEVLDAFGPVLKEYRYRNNFSMELRVVNDKAYFIDPCCRGPLPATGSQLELYGNYPEIIWYGANGMLIDPEPTAQFSAECIVKSKGEKGQWKKTVVPDELKDALKLSNCCEIDGAVCFPADDSHGEDIGWLISTGNTISDTIETMKEYESLLPSGLSIGIESLANLLKEIHESEKKGIEFTEQTVPEPAIVLED